jgi:hypothetical protein
MAMNLTSARLTKSYGWGGLAVAGVAANRRHPHHIMLRNPVTWILGRSLRCWHLYLYGSRHRIPAHVRTSPVTVQLVRTERSHATPRP